MPRIAQPTACICCARPFSRRVARSADSVENCDVCWEEAGYENAHSDGHHDDEEAGPQADCHVCQGTSAHAFLEGATVTSTPSPRNGAGRVASTADGRLKANAPTLPESPDRVRLQGTIRGQASVKYNGLLASVIRRSTHTWDRHAGDWVQVQIDGQVQCRWFYAEEVKPVRKSRARAS